MTASGEDWRRFLGRDDVVVMIAGMDETAAGYVSALRRPYLWGGENLLALDDLYVGAQFREAGVGRALMLELARHALPDRLSISWGLRPENEAAYRFYYRLGARLGTKTVASWSPSSYESLLAE